MGIFDQNNKAVPQTGSVSNEPIWRNGKNINAVNYVPEAKAVTPVTPGYANLGQAFDPNALQKDPATGQPLMPGYHSTVDQAGNLKDQYKVTAGTLGDSSTWQRLMQDKNALATNQAVGSAGARAMTGAREGISNLAQYGGVSGGSRERMAKDANKAAMFTSQEARDSGAKRGLDIGIQGESFDRDAQKFNIGNKMDADKLNVGGALEGVGGINKYNMGMYDTNLSQWGAQKSAEAQAQAAANRPKSIWERLGF